MSPLSIIWPIGGEIELLIHIFYIKARVISVVPAAFSRNVHQGCLRAGLVSVNIDGDLYRGICVGSSVAGVW